MGREIGGICEDKEDVFTNAKMFSIRVLSDSKGESYRKHMTISNRVVKTLTSHWLWLKMLQYIIQKMFFCECSYKPEDNTTPCFFFK